MHMLWTLLEESSSDGNFCMLIEHLACLQIDAAESKEIFKVHMTHLEHMQERELEHKRDSYVGSQVQMN